MATKAPTQASRKPLIRNLSGDWRLEPSNSPGSAPSDAMFSCPLLRLKMFPTDTYPLLTITHTASELVLIVQTSTSLDKTLDACLPIPTDGRYHSLCLCADSSHNTFGRAVWACATGTVLVEVFWSSGFCSVAEFELVTRCKLRQMVPNLQFILFVIIGLFSQTSLYSPSGRAPPPSLSSTINSDPARTLAPTPYVCFISTICRRSFPF